MHHKFTIYPNSNENLRTLANFYLRQEPTILQQDDGIVPLPASLAGKIKSAEFYFENITYWGDTKQPPNSCAEESSKYPIKPINNLLKVPFCGHLNYRGPAKLKFLNPRTSEELIKYAEYFYNAAIKTGLEFNSAIEEIKRYKEQYADRIKYKQDPDVDVARFATGKHIDFNPAEYSSGISITRKSGEHRITESSISSGSTRKIITDNVSQYNEMLKKMENEIKQYGVAFSAKDINNDVNIWLTAQMYYGTPYRSYDRTSSLKVYELVEAVFVDCINKAKELAYAVAEKKK